METPRFLSARSKKRPLIEIIQPCKQYLLIGLSVFIIPIEKLHIPIHTYLTRSGVRYALQKNIYTVALLEIATATSRGVANQCGRLMLRQASLRVSLA